MRIGECSPSVKAQSMGNVQGLGVADLNDPEENLVVPLDERDLEGAPEQLTSEAVGLCGEVEGATAVLVVVVADGRDDLVIDVAGYPAEVLYPHEAGAAGDPVMNLPLSESKISSRPHSRRPYPQSPAYLL